MECVELVALDAAGNEAVTELCVPVPTMPGEDAPPDPLEDEDASEQGERARGGALGCAGAPECAWSLAALFGLARVRRTVKRR